MGVIHSSHTRIVRCRTDAVSGPALQRLLSLPADVSPAVFVEQKLLSLRRSSHAECEWFGPHWGQTEHWKLEDPPLRRPRPSTGAAPVGQPYVPLPLAPELYQNLLLCSRRHPG